MIFQLSATLLAGCAVQAVADAPAAFVDAPVAFVDNVNADVPSPTTKDPLSAPTNNDNIGNRQRRLLKKFKKRKVQRLDAQAPADAAPAAADVGVLSSQNRRFLKLMEDDYACPRETCPAALCDCADDDGSLSIDDCASELRGVCGAGKLSGCVFKDYVHLYEEVYCPFVNCVGEGFEDDQCDCAFYELYCDLLSSGACAVQSDDPDMKLFAGCDERNTGSVCVEAARCKVKGNLQGLPDLGAWKGAVQTVGLNSGAGERMVGASAVAGVTLLSMLWFMVNA